MSISVRGMLTPEEVGRALRAHMDAAWAVCGPGERLAWDNTLDIDLGHTRECRQCGAPGQRGSCDYCGVGA